jgi:hypothetical protein
MPSLLLGQGPGLLNSGDSGTCSLFLAGKHSFLTPRDLDLGRAKSQPVRGSLIAASWRCLQVEGQSTGTGSGLDDLVDLLLSFPRDAEAQAGPSFLDAAAQTPDLFPMRTSKNWFTQRVKSSPAQRSRIVADGQGAQSEPTLETCDLRCSAETKNNAITATPRACLARALALGSE